jgi:hypothetical protein
MISRHLDAEAVIISRDTSETMYRQCPHSFEYLVGGQSYNHAYFAGDVEYLAEPDSLTKKHLDGRSRYPMQSQILYDTHSPRTRRNSRRDTWRQ